MAPLDRGWGWGAGWGGGGGVQLLHSSRVLMPLDGVTRLDVAVLGSYWASGVSSQFGFPRIIDQLVASNNTSKFHQLSKRHFTPSHHKWQFFCKRIADVLLLFGLFSDTVDRQYFPPSN